MGENGAISIKAGRVWPRQATTDRLASGSGKDDHAPVDRISQMVPTTLTD